MPASQRRVVVDATALSDGSQFRGIGTYLRRVLGGLTAYDDLDVLALATAGAELPDGVAVRTVARSAPPRWRQWETELRLPREVVASDAGVWHSPAQSPPRRCRVPWVQTLHDLTPLVFRHPLLAADRRRWEWVGPRLHRAAAVICVSQSSADQAQRLLGIDPGRLHVVPLGVDPAFAPDGPSRDVSAPYLLWVASWGPHKGLDEALATLSRLRGEGRPHRLVIAGHQDEAMLGHVRAAIRRARVDDAVVVAGHVSDLAPVYRGASAVLLTSRAEGFGLPAVEAMACGAPVVAFDNTSLPEVVGDGGLLVPDGDVAEFTDAVRRVLDDASLRQQLTERGPRRASTFSWLRTVERHVEVYRRVLAADSHDPA